MSDREDIQSPGARGKITGRQAVESKRRNLWALLVGISSYKHTDWNLSYADRDAKALEEHLMSPRGGGIPKERICPLINEKATWEAIVEGLRVFLQRPGRDDVVLLFFSCHGSPDPGRPNNFYLLAHNTDPDRVAATAVPMKEIQDALKDTLFAERVMVFIDACHGAAVGPAGPKGAEDPAAAMNRLLADISKSKPGVAILTAAERNQRAWEGEEWGGGHGVFSHYLLEGLRGAAAEEGVVKLGALFDYVKQKVAHDTSPPVRPSPQTPWDQTTEESREWSVSVVGDLVAKERYRLGRALRGVGLHLADPGRLEQAMSEHEESIRLARDLGQTLPDASYELGRCQLAAGRPSAALQTLLSALENTDREQSGQTPEVVLADLSFWAWAAAYQCGDAAAAEQTRLRFLEAHAEDPRAPFVKSAPAPGTGSRKALLVGISEYKLIPFSLQGPIHDVEMMRAFLQQQAGYAPEQIVCLVDAEATKSRIFAELTRLAAETAPGDEVLFYFSGTAEMSAAPEPSTAPEEVGPGHRGLGPSQEKRVRMLAADFNGSGDGAMEPADLHRSFTALHEKARTVVILDTCYGGGLLPLAAADPRYTLFSGTRGEELGEEITVDGAMHGRFTAATVKALSGADGPNLRASDLLRHVQAALGSSAGQTATLVGDGSLPLLGSVQKPAHAIALETAQRAFFGDRTPSEISALEARMEFSLFPEALLSLGRAYLDLDDWNSAARVLAHAVEGGGPCALAAHLGRAAALVHLSDYAAAQDVMLAAAPFAPAGRDGDPLSAARDVLDRLARAQNGHALIVAVPGPAFAKGAVARGALEDGQNLARALQDLFPDKLDVVRLEAEAATREAVLEAFKQLVERSAEEPCLFYFSGLGTPDLKIVTHDPAPGSLPTPAGVALSELAALAGPRAKNLVCIIDAGFARGVRLPWRAEDASRCAFRELRRFHEPAPWVAGPGVLPEEPSPPAASSHRDVSPAVDRSFLERRTKRAVTAAAFAIGGVTLFNASFLTSRDPDGAEAGENIVEATLPSPFDPARTTPQGVLTNALVTFLRDRGPSFTYGELCKTLARRLQWLQPVFIGAGENELFLSNPVLADRFERSIRRITFDEPLFDAIGLLGERLTRLDARGESPEKKRQTRIALRERGIAHLAAGEIGAAIEDLDSSLRADGFDDPEVRAYLGRALCEQGKDLDGAVSHLQESTRLWESRSERGAAAVPAHVRYHYGRALHDRMEQQQREDLERLRVAWRSYLAAGAPLGHRPEIEAYLEETTPRQR